jgi:L-rhamnose isomerase
MNVKVIAKRTDYRTYELCEVTKLQQAAFRKVAMDLDEILRTHLSHLPIHISVFWMERPKGVENPEGNIGSFEVAVTEALR